MTGAPSPAPRALAPEVMEGVMRALANTTYNDPSPVMHPVDYLHAVADEVGATQRAVGWWCGTCKTFVAEPYGPRGPWCTYCPTQPVRAVQMVVTL